MSDPYAFASEDEFDRHARAVRNVERMQQGQQHLALPQGLPTGHNQVIVQITGPMVDGVYPTLMRFINLETSGSTGVWYDGEEGRARELNDGTFILGRRYIGMIVGVKDGFAIVECDSTYPVNCIKVITGITSIACVDGEIVMNYTFKYVTGNFTISDTPCP